MPWGGWYHPNDSVFVDVKPPAPAGGVKAATYSGEKATDVKTTTAAAGAENIAGAGTIYAPELQGLLDL